MGFLERAIRRGVSDAVGKAIGKAIEPTVTDLTNKLFRFIQIRNWRTLQ